MCGIAGFTDPRISPDESRHLLEKMLQSIAHRGPDARETWIPHPLAFGHNRLSIIDLSEEGNQPMQYFDSVIIYNGEIYNYLEIRKNLQQRGYHFKTQSDTEVILAAYREYGERCVEHFMGMWAFALWDLNEQILFCSRDRFGIKPFHYIHDEERFYFASEQRALKFSPLFNKDVNWKQVSRGLQLNWNVYADETYYSAIKTLPPACNLIFSNGKVSLRSYWDLTLSSAEKGSFHDKSELFAELFKESIRMHMRSDVEVGACLSGGLDSSSIVSQVAKDYPDKKLKTFSVYYDGKGEVDERPWVQEVINKYPSLEARFLQPADDDIQEAFDRIVDHQEVPISGSSPISQYFVMQLAKQNGIKVLLDGQGSDEFLAGYLHSFYRLIGGKLVHLNLPSAFSEWSAFGAMQDMNFSKRMDVMAKSLLAGLFSEQALYTMEYRNYLPFLGPECGRPFDFRRIEGTPLKKFLYHLIFTTSLPTLLHYEDRNSMAFSIESRVPFLDHRLVEMAFSLQDDDLIHKGVTKRILRESLKDILPVAISKRKDKKGFVTPGEVKWLRGPLRHLLELDESRLDHLNLPRVRKLFHDFKKGDNRFAGLVWRVAILHHWLKKNA